MPRVLQPAAPSESVLPPWSLARRQLSSLIASTVELTGEGATPLVRVLAVCWKPAERPLGRDADATPKEQLNPPAASGAHSADCSDPDHSQLPTPELCQRLREQRRLKESQARRVAAATTTATSPRHSRRAHDGARIEFQRHELLGQRAQPHSRLRRTRGKHSWIATNQRVAQRQAEECEQSATTSRAEQATDSNTRSEQPSTAPVESEPLTGTALHSFAQTSLLSPCSNSRR